MGWQRLGTTKQTKTFGLHLQAMIEKGQDYAWKKKKK